MKLIPCLMMAALAQVANAAEPATKDAPVVMPQVDVVEAKTHTLFMGVDFGINLDRDLYPVRNVVGSDWVIVVNNENHEISSKHGAVDLKITPQLKLAEGEATIIGFQRKAAYSFDNDPSTRLTRSLTNAGALTGTLIGIQHDAQAKADTLYNKGLGAAQLYASSDQQFGGDAMLATAKSLGQSRSESGQVSSRSNPSPGAYPVGLTSGAAQAEANVAAVEADSAAEPTGRVATQGLDAMDIDFSISSPKPLHEPYVVTITRFHPAGAKPGMVQNLVYARALDPIDGHLSHVHFTEEGFPFDYQLVDFQLHLYDHGVEVATNIADNHVGLTRGEAFEYIKMEYVGAHPDATLDAEPALGKFPAQLPFYLHQGKYAQTFFVSVNKDGMPKASYADFGCKQKLNDPFLDSVVQGMWFKPALAHGKPVDGVAPVNLSKLTI